MRCYCKKSGTSNRDHGYHVMEALTGFYFQQGMNTLADKSEHKCVDQNCSNDEGNTT